MDSKAEFEKWLVSLEKPISGMQTGKLNEYRTQMCWQTWQACQALNDKRIAGEWIKCSERLPEFGLDVIVYIAGTKNVYSQSQSGFDYSKYSNYEPRVTVMRIHKSASSHKDSLKGIYWNYEKKGNSIPYRDDLKEFNLITHWQPLPEPPKD